MYCFSCAREVDDQWKFCRFCGQSIAVDCPECGARSPVDSLFCHECGAKMSELRASPDPPRGQPHYDRPTGLQCPRCRTANEPGSAYCYSCGLPLNEDLAVAHAPASYARPLGGSPYQSPRTRANWTVGLLVATCVVSGFVLLSMLDVLGMARQVVAGQYVSDADWNEAISNVDGLLALSFALLIATATAFLLWVHRASKNLVSLEAHGQRFSPAWAVGWWFVPIMMLFRPYQVMAEIWRGSRPDALLGAGYEWRARPVSPLLAWWWWTWIVARITSLVFYIDSISPEDAVPILLIVVLALALEIVAAGLAIAVVRRIGRGQEELHQELMTG